jgi:hypothetical protein
LCVVWNPIHNFCKNILAKNVVHLLCEDYGIACDCFIVFSSIKVHLEC